MTDTQKIFIVDDDEAVCDSLSILLDSLGFETETFSSAQAFLDNHQGDLGCLLLDIRMPGMNGMELQKRLNEMGKILPIIFITGHGDVPMAVEAMKEGAIDFLQKPFSDQDLMVCVKRAFEQLKVEQEEQSVKEANKDCYERLTPREKEVLNYLVDGAANKLIAYELNISPRTVEIHRARIMEKMEVRTLPDLVKKSLAFVSSSKV